MTQIRVHGYREPDAARQASALERGPVKGQIQVKHSVRVDFARAGREPATLDGIAPDDVVEMELDGGVKLWSSVDRMQADFGLAASRGAGDEQTIELGTQLALGGQSRGVGDWVLRGLKVLGVDVAGEITDFVADKIEGQLSPGPGLYRCSPTSANDLAKPRKLKGDGPTLVWLHGTGSSTQGGFAGLWADGGARMQEIARRYTGDMLALQHRTLTFSPIENARDLLKELVEFLPRGSELHLVSHSRGGLVGELIARGNRVGGGSFDATDLDLFKGRKRDLEAIKELRSLLDAQRYTVTRFVRVACPTRGTTLADRRLDRYLSVILNVLEHIPGLGASPIFDTFASLLAAVVKKRTEPEDLPGLEAMMPGSPLVRMLNRPDVRTDSVLRILGGDVEGTGFWGRLKAFVTDLYYQEDHDLVVNTPAMFGGTERAATPKYWIDTGGRVNHFNYFSNADTAGRLAQALSDVAAADFHDVAGPLGTVTESDYRKRAATPQPVVFVLPGIMGSTLTVDGSRVWIDRIGLARGAMADIRATATKVKAEALVDASYRDFVRHLAASHEVVPFPYDWRRPIAESAAALRKAIEARLDALEGTDQPVRLLAHSMGGLVVRAMLATAEGLATWRRMCAHPGARFVMLGTPNGGSHSIAAMLMGRDRLVQQLALLDLKNRHRDLLGIIAEFDGALQLLPHAGTLDLYDPAIWSRLHDNDAPADRGIFGSGPIDPSKSAGVNWTIPGRARLAAARASRDLLRETKWDATRMIYVAGLADQTPIDIVIDDQAPPGRRVTVMATRQGDGRVPWATGIPPELSGQTYYMEAAHGDLANTEESFPAIVDLLSNGTTAKLPRTAPATRGGGPEVFPLRLPTLEAFPDDQSLTAAALGGRPGRKGRPPVERVKVRVVHDDLAFARYPVLVGHYRDDVVVGAEAYLDARLQGRLRELQKLDLYPGPYNTAVAVLNDVAGGLPGALVAGLGQVGELTPGGLAATLTHALTLYAAEAVGLERRRRQQGQSTSDGGTLPLGVTALLVGAGAGGVTLADSIQAILRAVQAANARQVSATDASAPGARIAWVDLCELFEDRAIQATMELNSLARVSDFRAGFVFESVLASGKHGDRRATFDELPGWWQRVRIKRQKDGALKFESLTERARGEARLLPTQQRIVRELLERATRSTATNLELSGTLFELLVPRALKEQAPDRRDLVLVLDKTSAMLPWELMHDRWDAGARPISLDRGLIRQFVTRRFRPHVQRAAKDTALVVGDPPLDGAPLFKQLPGAAAEAKAVAEALRTGGFDTTDLVGPDAQWPTALAALYARPYRVLHIAAHGVYEFDPGDGRKMTGVVLGNGVYFTPAEFDQLRVVPDFVFINCCHLAAGGEYGREIDVAFHGLASNVAQQFIEMGVRAVVAAGWAVDDQAAKEFARVLYSEMLNGEEFGRAVREARQGAFAVSSAVNTWGAYQCYGDPGFVLTRATGRRDEDPFVAERQFRYEVLRVANTVRGSTRPGPELLDRLGALVKTAHPDWLKSGATAAAVAQAYGELGRFDEACEYYKRVLTADPATASLKSVEQLANLLARMAGATPKPDLKTIRDSIRLLEHLKGVGETSERLSLLAGTRKTLARKTTGAARLKALEDMTDTYMRGYALALKAKAYNPWYPLVNGLAGKVAASWQPGAPKTAAIKQSAEMKALREYARVVPASATDIWELFLPADVQVLEAAIAGELGVKARDTIAAAYRTAATRAGTPREVASATGQIVFLADMARSSRLKPIQALADSLDALARALTE
jgi:tetratricopeptide (TPR) repeat protein